LDRHTLKQGTFFSRAALTNPTGLLYPDPALTKSLKLEFLIHHGKKMMGTRSPGEIRETTANGERVRF
jgi:hypothetical protein